MLAQAVIATNDAIASTSTGTTRRQTAAAVAQATSTAGAAGTDTKLQVPRGNSDERTVGSGSQFSSASGKINLVGIMVGNGAIATGDWYEGWLTRLRTENSFSHGLFSPALARQITAACKNYTKGHTTPECEALLNTVTNQTGHLNQYDMRETCTSPPAGRPGAVVAAAARDPQRSLFEGSAGAVLHTKPSNPHSVTPTIGDGPGEDPCDLGGVDVIAWLSRSDVQTAIHVSAAVPTSPTPTLWADCGGSFGRDPKYTRIPQDERVSVYPHLIGRIKVLIFNGDQVCARFGLTRLSARWFWDWRWRRRWRWR
jgi:hypothetical protein